MGLNITHKILKDKLIAGELKTGEEIIIKVDHTLTQDTTGTMAYLQLEAMKNVKRQTSLSVAYVDHNTLQLGFENADDHEFIRSVCQKYGMIYSKAGNGICHQIHLERYSKPGIVLIGSDSHTPTSGGIGALAIGSGGLDIAIGIAKGYYYLTVPKVMNIHLTGQLAGNASSKDVILTILKKLSVKGGVGYILEYTGTGVSTLSVTERATITNMGTELGATTSIFPSDDNTLNFLNQQNRTNDYTALHADENADYDETLHIDLSAIEPMVACPHSPDNVQPVNSFTNFSVNQVAIGSCTNSSYDDLMRTAAILKGKKVHPNISLVISPGSSSILHMLTKNGALADLLDAGARILEASCGPCIGMGQAPRTEGISLRTFNRNFKGRCGTDSADVYLVSPETAALSAITGELTCPNSINSLKHYEPEKYHQTTNYIIDYRNDQKDHIIMGPNIKPFPVGRAVSNDVYGSVLFKGKDHITTDDIVPSHAGLLPLRSNVPALSAYAFHALCPAFKERANRLQGGFIVAGENYGQGSSREHAALLPVYLGVRAVIAKSFARIHKKNLINSAILPLVFEKDSSYEDITENDELCIRVDKTLSKINVDNITTNKTYPVKLECSEREKAVLLSGGAIKYEEALCIESP